MKKFISLFLMHGAFFGLLKPAFSQTAKGIRDVKAPVALPASYWVLLIVLVVLLATAAIFLFLRWKKNQKPKEKVFVPDPTPPWERAYQLLEELMRRNLLAQRQFYEFYSVLSDIVRKYLEERFSIRAPEMTTEEFLYYLTGTTQLNTQQKESLSNFMISCDLVKFAKYEPRVEDAQNSFELAKKLIQETKMEESPKL